MNNCKSIYTFSYFQINFLNIQGLLYWSAMNTSYSDMFILYFNVFGIIQFYNSIFSLRGFNTITCYLIEEQISLWCFFSVLELMLGHNFLLRAFPARSPASKKTYKVNSSSQKSVKTYLRILWRLNISMKLWKHTN